MSSTPNPLTHPLAQIHTFSPQFIEAGGGSGGDNTGASPWPDGGGFSTGNNPPTTIDTPTGGTITVDANGNPIKQTTTGTAASQFSFFGFSLLRLALFLLGLIFIIGGIYLLKPGIIEAPVRAAKSGLEAAGAAAAVG